MFNKKIIVGVSLLVGVISLLIFVFFRGNGYLKFSDAAKIGEIGKSIINGSGFASKFIFYANDPVLNSNGLFSARVMPPVTPYLTALSFKIFGISDFAVILVSGISFVLMVLATYLLGERLYGVKTGLFASLAIAFSIPLLGYAASGASETTFIAIMLFAVYLLSLDTRRSNIVGLLLTGTLFLVRAQAPFYVIPILFYFLLKKLSFRSTLLGLAAVFIVGILITGVLVVVPNIPGTELLRERILVSLAHNSSFIQANDVLRTSESQLPTLIINNLPAIAKKVMYGLYNFVKLSPDIFNPFLLTLFLFSFGIRSKSKRRDNFKLAVGLLFVVVYLSTAITVPIYRYLHPLIPFMYILAISTVEVILKNIETKKVVIYLTVLFFILIQYFGYVFLDSRFERKTSNYGKPTSVKMLSKILADNTRDSDVVVTNLDTWGSWYGNRRTIWYPLKPEDLEFSKTKIDAIYLTSYLIDDENYFMDSEWRDVYDNPHKVTKNWVYNNFVFVGEYTYEKSEVFENIPGKAVLFIRK